MKITVSGNLFTLSSAESKRIFLAGLTKTMCEAAQKAIVLGFERSVQLAAMVGERIDQEAIRTIYRSLKVKVKSENPLRLEAKFEDDYSHWYSGEKLPQELADILQEIIKESISRWFNSPEPARIIKKALVGR